MAGDCETCGEEFVVVRDESKYKAPHKEGNPYMRYCGNCGRRRYCSKQYWLEQEDRYILPKEGNQPVHVFECPNCGQENTGFPTECSECGVVYEWGEIEIDEETGARSES